MDRLKIYGMHFEDLTQLTKEFLPPRMFKCLTRTENLGEIIRSGGNRKSNDDDGGNEGLLEEEVAWIPPPSPRYLPLSFQVPFTYSKRAH